jgi:hypothetical protein
MDLVAIDRLVLRTQLQDVALRPGLVLAGRVAERQGQHGLLVLAGLPLVAELPDEVPEGARLRLRVSEVGDDKVMLQVLRQDATPLAQPPAPARPLVLPLGDGRAATVAGDGDGAVLLRYESPALGRMDLRIDPHACAVHVAAGAAAAVRGGAGDLRVALAQALGRPVQVTIHPRAESLDVQA